MHVLDRAFVYVARRKVAGGNQITEPLRRVGINLVVVGRHSNGPPL